jgi:hypothetical protein
MSTSAISNLSGSYLEQALYGALQSITSSTAGSTTNASSTTGATSAQSESDSSHLSPFAQLVSALQELQQADPTEYKQFTAQVGANLQSEAQTVQRQGNPGVASQLTQLAADFTGASQTGQLPNLQDLAEAVGGGGSDSGAGGGGHRGHHHHHHAETTSTIYQTLTSAGLGAQNS